MVIPVNRAVALISLVFISRSFSFVLRLRAKRVFWSLIHRAASIPLDIVWRKSTIFCGHDPCGSARDKGSINLTRRSIPEHDGIDMTSVPSLVCYGPFHLSGNELALGRIARMKPLSMFRAMAVATMMA